MISMLCLTEITYLLQNATLARLFSIDLFKGKHFIVYTDNKDTDILQLLGNMYSDLVQLKKNHLPMVYTIRRF